MPDEPIVNQISDHLSDALFRSNEAVGVVIAMAMKDGSVWTYSAGSAAVKLGLVYGLALNQEDKWRSMENE